MKTRKRENERKDIWFTESDMQRVIKISQEMERKGINPYRQGKLNISKVVRYALERCAPQKLGG